MSKETDGQEGSVTCRGGGGGGGSSMDDEQGGKSDIEFRGGRLSDGVNDDEGTSTSTEDTRKYPALQEYKNIHESSLRELLALSSFLNSSHAEQVQLIVAVETWVAMFYITSNTGGYNDEHDCWMQQQRDAHRSGSLLTVQEKALLAKGFVFEEGMNFWRMAKVDDDGGEPFFPPTPVLPPFQYQESTSPYDVNDDGESS